LTKSPVITFAETLDAEVAIGAVAGGTLLDAALASGLPHLHDCGGHARCTTCRVRVIDGLQNLSAPTAEEAEIALTYAWPDDVRLACQAEVRGDIRVERLVSSDRRSGHEDEDTLLARSEERKLAVLFCDVNGFTDFAAGRLPYDVVHVVNRLFLRMGEAVLAEHGYIDKYLGDGLLALWGMHGGTSGEICLAAVRAGLLMHASVSELQRQLTDHFGCELSLRLGIHFGSAIVGRIGHPARQQVTAIGDTVNVASRVEAANKDLRTSFLITEECYDQIKEQVITGDDFKTILRGQTRPRRLFEVAGLQNPDAIFIAQCHLPAINAAGEEFVKRFYQNLFRVAPGLERLFEQTDMPRQHVRFLEFFSWSVHELRHEGRMIAGLKELADRHRGYGVRPEDYSAAGQAVIGALTETLGERFNDEAREAWTTVFRRITNAMQSPRSDAQSRRKTDDG
jgi:class 3 adenylate cyclase/hemoglobin-like flavoprotein